MLEFEWSVVIEACAYYSVMPWLLTPAMVYAYLDAMGESVSAA